MSDPKAIVTQALAKFINEWPLYTPFELPFDPPLPYPPSLPNTILRDCSQCKATPTWAHIYPVLSTPQRAGGAINVGIGSVVAYQCTHCSKESIRIWYSQQHDALKGPENPPLIARAVYRKLGQWPAQQVEPDREIVKTLPEPLLELFKKGLTSLAHGYGLGALAYLRRVIEEGSTQLIDLFADRAQTEGDAAAAQAIRAAKTASHMEDRLKAAADGLPLNLRPGGVNPLTVLYNHYSRGIHGLSDSQCLEVAQQLLFAMQYIFSNWRRQMDEAAEFRRTVQKWSDPTRLHERSG